MKASIPTSKPDFVKRQAEFTKNRMLIALLPIYKRPVHDITHEARPLRVRQLRVSQSDDTRQKKGRL